MAKLKHRTDYRPLREQAYPPIGDALDAIQKGFRAIMARGIEIGPEAKAWVDACEQVKRTIKKPQG